MIDVSHIKAPPLDAKVFRFELQKLPTFMQKQALAYRRQADAESYLLGKLLLLKAAVRFGFNEQILSELDFTTYGRPFIPNTDFDFNLSHSAGHITCVASSTCRVGIDIELVTPLQITDFTSVLQIEELEKISISTNPSLDFFRCWTQKEAIAKANGKGLQIGLQQIVVDIENTSLIEAVRWHLTELHLAPNCVCHIATDIKILPECFYVRQEDYNTLVNLDTI